VRVAVEQPGQQRGAGGVDDLVAVEPGADRDDAIALDSDVGAGGWGAGAVEDLSTGDQGTGHGLRLVSPRPVGHPVQASRSRQVHDGGQ